MNIQSHLFVLLFLPATVILWRLTARWWGSVGSRVLLLCAGVLFCGWESPLSLAVLLGEGVLSWFAGRAIARGRNRKLWLAVSVTLLLAVLVLFKYTGWLLSLTPLEGLLAPSSLFAPLGLSFLTFQQIFWLRDCLYREEGEVSPLDFACCLTFFATVTCGPITRVGELAPRLRQPRPFDWEDLSAGLYCFALGLGKKVLLAGMFAGGANYGYGHAGALTATDGLITVLCYTLQIYFDFSGYCDMASGMARMMGVELPVNFDSPYQACSVEDFWSRWHITLSRFFRSCVYIPLGGNRRGTAVTCRNIMLIFLLSGLWHGAGWGFLVWGGLHGAAMVLQRLCRGKCSLPRPLGWLLTFLFVNVAWVFFRAGSLGQALALLGDLAGGLALPSQELLGALLPGALGKAARSLQWMLREDGMLLTYWLPMAILPAGLALLTCPDPATRLGKPFRGGAGRAVLAVACLVLSVLLFSGVDTFIYANF